MSLPTVDTLRELAELVEKEDSGLYVRWSKGPDPDLADPGEQTSRDALTGVPLPGLSANPLTVEPWWGDRPVLLWVARRLYDYRHLRELRGPGVRPWVLIGEEIGRGPDNEPLVHCRRPIAWIAEQALTESEHLINAQHSPDWGPLDRTT
ncbi:DUF6098 family protein [Phytohabitans aurantiacus]|uniref:Uncharacterized protein n=1 Tax=Phytohabitans aurantiacus TaxID=3016789 RepID=A0ABQ5R8N1_9ACTN|nr:DUF6098 family protein [Phytohabitans aurantiacus]GLI03015.1 hypothetical protein Pa4123_82930 [Phytohabitans aurantiacus]